MKHDSLCLTLAEIAEHLGATLRGESERRVRGLSTLKDAEPDQVAFMASRAYLKDLPDTRAAAVLLHPQYVDACPVDSLALDNPYLGYADLSLLFDPLSVRDTPGIHPAAVVDDSARLGEGVCVGAQAVVEAGVELGEGVVIGPGCVIGADSQIGP